MQNSLNCDCEHVKLILCVIKDMENCECMLVYAVCDKEQEKLITQKNSHRRGKKKKIKKTNKE